MLVLGIDPGITGALCAFDTELNALQILDTPSLTTSTSSGKTRADINDAVLAQWLKSINPEHAFIELVGAAPGQGVVSMFRFGMFFGVVRGVLAALQVPVTFVAPPQWKRATRCPQGDDGSNIRATQLFPHHANLFARKKDHGRADATLIAYYGKNILQG